MGMLFTTAATQDLIDKLNRVFRAGKIDDMRKPNRVNKFGPDAQGRSLARCAKHFRLHPGPAGGQHALRWFWLLRNWQNVTQTDPDSGYNKAIMAVLIKGWIYEALTFRAGGDFWFKSITFSAGASSGAPYASVQRNGDHMIITANTPNIPDGVEHLPGYDTPPGPDPNENPPDPDDAVDPGVTRRRHPRRKRARRKAAPKAQ